jgi:hypothetical protein
MRNLRCARLSGGREMLTIQLQKPVDVEGDVLGHYGQRRLGLFRRPFWRCVLDGDCGPWGNRRQAVRLDANAAAQRPKLQGGVEGLDLAQRSPRLPGELLRVGVVVSHLAHQQRPGDEPALAALVCPTGFVGEPAVQVESERRPLQPFNARRPRQALVACFQRRRLVAIDMTADDCHSPCHNDTQRIQSRNLSDARRWRRPGTDSPEDGSAKRLA